MIGQNPYDANRGAPLVVGRASIAAAPAPRRHMRAPTRDELGYARELMIVVLMVVAFPWLFRKAFTNPGAILRGANPIK